MPHEKYNANSFFSCIYYVIVYALTQKFTKSEESKMRDVPIDFFYKISENKVCFLI